MEKNSGAARIEINGEPRHVAPGATLADVLKLIGAPKSGFAVEKNGDIVPKSRHASEEIREGDRLEIVTFVGGG
ncbi:MAG: sulfur carrier protein ThiS [Planctomycetes bacterium]|nr:sulfur carrier protein ThiS [Planctomycetota bacterium]